ncbi:GLPGLI family protein [Empedobacter tilapiae]|uniref:GLPGLI family protein n=1 Tax=Empedobacter tilapiae TaxID=2491114 RepID=A0A4Z1BJH2_9FLAO|nr:GLPGLI family protein [Empedobacter tilapiae]TGN30061.1 GLPGLI family protein [Empedobacter tilapiae]
MKKLIVLIVLVSSYVNAQFYEVEYETQIKVKYNQKGLDFYKDITDFELRKQNIDQNENPAALEFKFILHKDEANTIELPKVENVQGQIVFIKKSAPYMYFGTTYFNTEKQEVLMQQDVYGKKYIVYDKINNLDWKLSNETKEILGYKAQKATANFNDRIFVAWFVPEIKTDLMLINFMSPGGLVLDLEISYEDEMGEYFGFYKANSVKEKSKYKIVIPTKGNKISNDELEKIWDDLDKRRNEVNNEGIDKK